MKILLAIIIGIIGITILFILDLSINKSTSFPGTVIDKKYNPEITSIGVGVATTSGKSGVVQTVSTSEENWILIVQRYNGEIITVDCDKNIFYKKTVGSNVFFKKYYGFITGWYYGSKAIK